MSKKKHDDLVGLVPAAGQAQRVAPLPCSKELFPVRFASANGADTTHPRPACHCLMERMRQAGVERAYVVLREGKWDIPEYLGDGAELDLHLAYLMMRHPFGVPFTLDAAYPFVCEQRVVLGFPDILFEPPDAIARMRRRQEVTGADVVLGLFLADRPEKVDMVQVDEDDRIQDIVIKPGQTDLRWAWLLALWTSAFSRLMHEHVIEKEEAFLHTASPPELFVGHVLQAALERGLHVTSVRFDDGRYLDIGTPDDLSRAAHPSNPFDL